MNKIKYVREWNMYKKHHYKNNEIAKEREFKEVMLLSDVEADYIPKAKVLEEFEKLKEKLTNHFDINYEGSIFKVFLEEFKKNLMSLSLEKKSSGKKHDD